jgi:signal transduction histidine kinase
MAPRDSRPLLHHTGSCMNYHRNIAEPFQNANAQALDVAGHDVALNGSRSRPSSQDATQQNSCNYNAQELLTMVCHELRSPVAAVRHGVRLWAGHAPETPERQLLRSMIERQIRSMTRLIDDVLDVSRVANDRMQLQCELLDLRRTVALAIETVASEVDARGHQLVSSVPLDPVWVTGDPFRLEQVFVNLLANAIKYTGHGGRLAIHTELHDNEAIVRVRDSGIGIAPRVLPHIFDLFRQGEQTDVQSRAGLGIGLAIVRSLVELHGGNVCATSRGTGHGSEFTVSLPRAG